MDIVESVHCVAFKNGKFLLVFNQRRNGWEFPGGKIETGESVVEAAKREALEECGHNVNIIATMTLGSCNVCACELLDKVNDHPEMCSQLFHVLPPRLFFDRTGYEVAVAWARSVIHAANLPSNSEVV